VTFVIAVLLACVLTTSGVARRRRAVARRRAPAEARRRAASSIGGGIASTGGELIAGQALESSTGGGSWSPWTKWNQQRKMENAMNDEMDAELLSLMLNEE
uniref:Uncharacterized LOC100179635 n=2 Tax=Ciona intestinalis TaxID=7719 RepID=F6T692_CIOIN